MTINIKSQEKPPPETRHSPIPPQPAILLPPIKMTIKIKSHAIAASALGTVAPAPYLSLPRHRQLLLSFIPLTRNPATHNSPYPTSAAQ